VTMDDNDYDGSWLDENEAMWEEIERTRPGAGLRRMCVVCYKPITQPKRGRRRVTCSDACRQKLHRTRNRGDEWKRQWEAAKRQVARWEKKYGEVNPRLVVRLSRGMAYQRCRVCHKPFISDARPLTAKYCSPECTKRAYDRKWYGEHEPPAGSIIEPLPDDTLTRKRIELRLDRGWPLKTCPACGKLFIDDGTRPAKYCSKRCRQAMWRYLNPPTYRKCAHCEKRFRVKKHHRNTQKYCSRKCLWRAREVRRRPAPKQRRCLECGVTFVVKGNQKWCSHACWQKAYNRQRREAYKRREGASPADPARESEGE
jgi:predicted nucleic acid-binding Zn ribbon protein